MSGQKALPLPYALTDLACERRRVDIDLPGVNYSKSIHGKICKETIDIISQEGADSIGRLPGKYITLHFDNIVKQHDENFENDLSTLLSEELMFLRDKYCGRSQTVLVAGLGNRKMTSDSIGCVTAERVIATDHLERSDPILFNELSCGKLTVITPGVLGQTGIEAVDIIRGSATACNAKIIIAIDALAARSSERLATTIQICDTGITPGSGIGNYRSAINEQSTGIPVIAIGVPTVINTSAIVYNFLSEQSIELSAKQEEILRQECNHHVSLKDIDEITDKMSSVISHAINIAFGIFSNNDL